MATVDDVTPGTVTLVSGTDTLVIKRTETIPPDLLDPSLVIKDDPESDHEVIEVKTEDGSHKEVTEPTAPDENIDKWGGEYNSSEDDRQVDFVAYGFPDFFLFS